MYVRISDIYYILEHKYIYIYINIRCMPMKCHFFFHLRKGIYLNNWQMMNFVSSFGANHHI